MPLAKSKSKAALMTSKHGKRSDELYAALSGFHRVDLTRLENGKFAIIAMGKDDHGEFAVIAEESDAIVQDMACALIRHRKKEAA